MTKYEYAEDVKEVAEKLIEGEDKFKHIDINDIIFLKTDKHISGGHVLGRTHELINMVQFITDKKYVIEVPPVFYTKNEKVKEIIVKHELMHIPVGKVGEEQKGLVRHDIEDFREIIKEFGMEWIQEVEDAKKKVKKLKEIEKKKKQQKDLEEEKDEIIKRE